MSSDADHVHPLDARDIEGDARAFAGHLRRSHGIVPMSHEADVAAHQRAHDLAGQGTVDPKLTGLNTDEMAEVELIFLRHIDEDDAMSILQDLLTGGFLIVSRDGVERIIQAAVEAAANHACRTCGSWAEGDMCVSCAVDRAEAG